MQPVVQLVLQPVGQQVVLAYARCGEAFASPKVAIPKVGVVVGVSVRVGVGVRVRVGTWVRV